MRFETPSKMFGNNLFWWLPLFLTPKQTSSSFLNLVKFLALSTSCGRLFQHLIAIPNFWSRLPWSFSLEHWAHSAHMQTKNVPDNPFEHICFRAECCRSAGPWNPHIRPSGTAERQTNPCSSIVKKQLIHSTRQKEIVFSLQRQKTGKLNQNNKTFKQLLARRCSGFIRAHLN